MKLSKKNLNKILIWGGGGGVILVIIIIIYSYNKKLFIENFESEEDKKINKYDTCISNNLKTPFENIAKTCNLPNDFSCNAYFKNDLNNVFQSKVIKGVCSPIFDQDEKYVKNGIKYKTCNNPKKIYVKFYDINGNILTYDTNKTNKGWILYNDNIFKKYPNFKQVNIECK